MNIYIGADHRGFELKKQIAAQVEKAGYKVVDVGTHVSQPPCDYPKISYDVAAKVAKEKDGRGILVCMTGIGHAIAANKVKGAYAALCYTKESAEFSRAHNNSNILVLGARFTSPKVIPQIVDAWLTTKFEGGRHLRRVNQIKKIEEKENRMVE